MAAFRILISSARGMESTGSVANSLEEAMSMIKSWGGNPNEYAEYVVVTPDGKHVAYHDSLKDGIEKESGGWTNKGKEGTHGKFSTKEEAREQQKAMYANGYKGDAFADARKKDARNLYNGDVVEGDGGEWWKVTSVKKSSEDIEVSVVSTDTGERDSWYFVKGDTVTVKDSAVMDGKIVEGEGRSMDGIPYGKYVEGGRSYRGFEITSDENGLRKGVYRFYNWGGGVPFGNSAVDGQFSEAQFQKLIGEGKVKLLDSEPNGTDMDETHAFGDKKMFKVTDKKTGKTLLVRATDSVAAVKRVSSLKSRK